MKNQWFFVPAVSRKSGLCGENGVVKVVARSLKRGSSFLDERWTLNVEILSGSPEHDPKRGKSTSRLRVIAFLAMTRQFQAPATGQHAGQFVVLGRGRGKAANWLSEDVKERAGG